MYSSDEEDIPAKRPKLFRACVQCVTAKTRCEDVKLKGCSTCRRKKRPCSLAGAVATLPDNDAGPASVGGAAEGSRRSSMQPRGVLRSSTDGWHPGQPDTESRISDLERRILVQERELNELRVALSASRPRESVANVGDRSDSAEAEIVEASERPMVFTSQKNGGQKYHMLMHFAQLEDFSETLFAHTTPEAYPSAVDAGILRADEVELAFQLFKHRFSMILPLAPFLSITTPAPTHNFVILAVLHHVPAYSTSKLAPLVNESIITALSGNISLDVILALLILSVAPVVPSRKRAPSPLRLISLAYQSGRDLGIDGKVDSFLARGEDLALPFWSEAMWMVQIWTAVVNRYNILHLLHGHGRPLPSSPAGLIPRSGDHNVQLSNNHLQDEDRLSQLALDTMRPLMVVEAGQHDFEEVKRAMQIFQAGMETLIAWKRSEFGSPLLDLDQRCLEHIAVSRLSFLFQRIPSPLQPIRQTLLNGMSIFVVTAQRFIATLFPDPALADPPPILSPHFLRESFSTATTPHSASSLSATRSVPPIPTLPAHVAMCALLAVLSLRGTAAWMRWREPHVPGDFLNIRRLVRAEEHLRQLGGRMIALLEQADATFGPVADMIAAASPVDEPAVNSLATERDPPRPGGTEGSGQGSGNVAISGKEQNYGPPFESMPGFDWNDVSLSSNNLFNPGFFDLDLFSWDPNFLAPDWVPGVPSGPGIPFGQTATTSAETTNMLLATSPTMRRPVQGSMTPTQQEWANALR